MPSPQADHVQAATSQIINATMTPFATTCGHRPRNERHNGSRKALLSATDAKGGDAG